MAKDTKEFSLLLVSCLAVRVCYIWAFPYAWSLDLTNWDKVGDILMTGGNPYHLTIFLNWPPFWMQMIYLFKKISLTTHLPFNIVVQSFLMLAESALLWLLYKTVKQFTEFKNPSRLLLFGIAINPIPIFQVCQHCNFDVLIGWWVLLAIYMLLRFQKKFEPGFWLLACFSLGMGILTKTVPICLTPLLLISVRKLKRIEQLIGVVLLLGPCILGLSILYVLGPKDIETKVLGYRSYPGFFGLTGLFNYWGNARLLAIYPIAFEILYGLGLLILGAWMLLKETLSKRQMILVAVAILLAIPTLGPGYSPQYVYWYLPLLVLMYALVERRIRILLLVLYGVGLTTYSVEYALLPGQGASLFNVVLPGKLLKFAAKLSTETGQTFLRLPLWLVDVAFVALIGTTIIKEMAADFKNAWARRSHKR